jgi:perosamine synthetase
MSELKKIPLSKPSITELEVSYATDAARHGWGDQCFGYIQRFEKSFSDYIGSTHALATSSCTGALQLGMDALGIGPGDEVILADTNWVATVAPILHLGATPVLVDIKPETWCIDSRCVERAITPATKAIIVTHLYGNLGDMDELLELATKHNIYLIEDAAEAMGAMHRGRRAGSMGIFSGFSFHGSKTMTTGEGGMFVTRNAELYEKVLTLSNHGRSRHQTKQFWPEVLGYKYKMSNLQAALGCGQLERIQSLVERRREILRLYQERLLCLNGISMNPELENTYIGAWMPTVVFHKTTGITADLIIPLFQRQQIDARVFFHPLSQLPFINSTSNTPVATDIAHRAINLPSYHDMTVAEIDRVVEVIREALNA